MMALPIDVMLPDYSNLSDITKKIIFCCNKMQTHILGTLKEYDGKQFISTPEGLGFEPVIQDKNNHPQIFLCAEGQLYEPIAFCPFCGTHIEIRPS